ncbi:adenosylcobinamide-GDP ribazoletransferase [Rhizorhabdus argentea]|uniref:adenosylcobinamide-GDP ribazoletransferase n=1 Tax=Rhizorhabdus argentea TaxID=1387174 RepID=UPI0030EB955B
MSGFILALQFLTRLPTPNARADGDAFARSIRWFPAVGLVVGALVMAAAWAGRHVDSWTGAVAGLVAWVLVTGALHLDGLSDLADAIGAAHKDRRRLLAVLADPHVGSFGVVAIALQLIVKFVLLHAMIERDLLVALILVPFAARIGPLLWVRWLPPLHDGLGSLFRGVIRPADIAAWTVLLIAGLWFAPALLAAPILIAGWSWWLGRKVGGISGDGHGAGIELVETGLLVALVAEAALR